MKSPSVCPMAASRRSSWVFLPEEQGPVDMSHSSVIRVCLPMTSVLSQRIYQR